MATSRLSVVGYAAELILEVSRAVPWVGISGDSTMVFTRAREELGHVKFRAPGEVE
jgi:hypothetical protein